MNFRPLKKTFPHVFAIGVALFFSAQMCCAQAVQSPPVTDSAAQASPLTPLPKQPVVDAAAEASPVDVGRVSTASIPPHVALPIVLNEAIDSGLVKNGQRVHATLTSPVKSSNRTLPVGTPVTLTVVETVPAGKINAVGELSLQVVRVGPVNVFTETQTFRGQEGHKDLPDSAPALGTDAGLAKNAPLTFHVQPDPVAASGPPKQRSVVPGSVNGIASGDAPPADASSQPSGSANGTGNIPSGQTPQTVAPAATQAPSGTTVAPK